MIRFSAPGHLFTFGASREGAYSGQGAYFFFEKQPNVQKDFNIYLKTNNDRNCNSNKYCTDGECSINVRNLP